MKHPERMKENDTTCTFMYLICILTSEVFIVEYVCIVCLVARNLFSNDLKLVFYFKIQYNCKRLIEPKAFPNQNYFKKNFTQI